MIDLSPAQSRSYEAASAEMRRQLQSVLENSPLVIRKFTSHLAKAPGKFLRAHCLMAAAMDSDGQLSDDAIAAAVAIELIHLASLVHDDIMDKADLRRGIPTLNKVYGNRTAVICGDYLLSCALQTLGGLTDKNAFLQQNFSNYLSLLCLGELKQHLSNGDFNLTTLQYLRIINGKTAALFEAAFVSGAVIAGLTPAQMPPYRHFGHYLGMIFQLTDDCLDFESTSEDFGKNVESDYEQNVFTLPLIVSFREEAAFKIQAMEAAAEGRKLARKLVNAAVIRNHGLSRTHRLAEKYAIKARQELARMEASEEKLILFDHLLKKALRES